MRYSPKRSKPGTWTGYLAIGVGMISLLCMPAASAQISITNVDNVYIQEFNTLANTGSSNTTMPTGWAFHEPGSDNLYQANNGNSNTANTYSYGSASNTERALGEISSNTLTSRFGAYFTNNTGSTITSLLINYTGEQWRLGTNGMTDQIDFQYSLDATTVNSGTWTDVNQLDFISPVQNGSPGLLVGNLAANRTMIGYVITGLSIANGNSFWIRWLSVDTPGGDDHGLAVDDFFLTANPSVHYNIDQSGGVYTITDLTGNGETMHIVQNSTNTIYYVGGRLYSINNAGQYAFPNTVMTAGYTAYTINTQEGNDRIVFGANNTTSLPGVTVNGGNGNDAIVIEGAMTFATGSVFDLDLQNDSATPGVDSITVSSAITLNNSASCVIKVSRNILLNATGSILANTGNITLESNQQAVPTSGSFTGIQCSGPITISGSGILSMKARGGTGTAVPQYGIRITSSGDILGGTAGTTLIEGTGGNSSGNGNSGIRLESGTSTIKTNGSNLQVTGYGMGTGTSAGGVGIYLLDGAEIIPGGNGTLTMEGHGAGSTGLFSSGIYLRGSSVLVSSNNGNVNVYGYGGGSGTAGQCHGVELVLNSTIRAGMDKSVFVQGSGGLTGGDNNYGVFLNTGIITSTTGSVNVMGFGGGNGTGTGHHGIHMQGASALISAGGSGNVHVEGEGGNGATATHGISMSAGTITSSGGNVYIGGLEGSGGSSYGCNFTTGINVTTTAFGGNITFNVNSLSSAGTIQTPAFDTLKLFPFNAGAETELTGTADASGGPLRLSETELDLMVTGTMVIGNSTAGKITVDQDVTRLASTNMIFTSAGDILLNSGSINTNTGNVRLLPGSSPAGVKPNANTPEIIAINTSIEGPLHIEINGTTPGSQYEQLSINGNVIVTGASLIFSGTHVPLPNQSFTIVENDGTDAIIGTFNGLPQGGTVVNFMGSGYPATITYTGGTGNDVVVTVGSPYYLITTANGVMTITDVAATANGMNISSSGSNIQLTESTRTYSLNGGTVTSLPYTFDPSPYDTIRADFREGDDAVYLGYFPMAIPTLDINGGAGNDGVLLTADVLFEPNASLIINLQDDMASPGTDYVEGQSNADIQVSGTGTINIQASHYIAMNSTSLVSVDGDIIIKANDQTPAISGALVGVSFNTNSLVQCNGSGDIEVRGTGSGSTGVLVTTGSDIVGGVTGHTSVYGKGAGNNDMSNGVQIYSPTSMISSQGGDVEVTGIGGAGSGGYKDGVFVWTGATISAGGTGEVEVTGTGGSSNNGACIGVHLVDNATITSGGGQVNVLGTGGVSSGTFNAGVYVALNSKIQATGNGNLIIEGTGGASTGNYNYGVFLYSSDALLTALGNLTVIGTGGGAGGSGGNVGIFFETGSVIHTGGNIELEGNAGLGGSISTMGILLNTFLETDDGSITLNGAGATSGTATFNRGIYINSGTGAGIEAGGNGHIHCTALGGNTATVDNWGLTISGANTSLITNNGNITLIGNGGLHPGAQRNYGVAITNGADVFAGGAGEIIIDGAGGINTGSFNYGVRVANTGTTLMTNTGPITIEGQGGGNSATSNSNAGINIFSGARIKPGAMGAVTLTGIGGSTAWGGNYGVEVASSNAEITSSGGPVSIHGTGGSAPAGANNFGVYVNSGGKITSGGTAIITVNGTGGGGSGSANHGVLVAGTNAIITSAGGDIHVTGTAGNGDSQNHGIAVIGNGQINATGNGNVFLDGQASLISQFFNSGVFLYNAGYVRSVNGDIHINGQGGGMGNGEQNYGVLVFGGGFVQAETGDVLIDGVGGTTEGLYNIGVSVSVGAVTGDSISIVGQGGGTGDSPGDNYGVEIVNSGSVTATDAVSITGYSGTIGVSGNSGVLLAANGQVSSGGGPIEITGESLASFTASQNMGVHIYGGSDVSTTGPNDIIINGIGGNGFTENHGVFITSNSTITTDGGDISIHGEGDGGMGSYGFVASGMDTISTEAGDGNIYIQANTMSIGGLIKTSSNNRVELVPMTPGHDIELDSMADNSIGPLRLNDTELDWIHTSQLHIGSPQTGYIHVKQAIVRPMTTHMELIAGYSLYFDNGSINTAGGNLHLIPGPFPQAIYPNTDITEVFANGMFLEGGLFITVYSQGLNEKLSIEGTVDIDGVDLSFISTYLPIEGDSFLIVVNDSMDPVIGTFNGLPEGGVIPNFLGSTLNGVITYTGGDGNDIVIHAVNPCTLPDIPVLGASQDTVCESTPVTLTIQSGNLGGATQWHWYANACGTILIGTGTSIMVSPTSTTTYFARGEGGCVTASQCGQLSVVVNPPPDATIDRETSGPCYFTENIFQPEAPVIPGATYNWNFGAGAQPLSATGYGPHMVIYTSSGPKTARLVIHPNAPGAQCPDSSLLNFTINNCPGQIIGEVRTLPGEPMNNVNVKLFPDANADGVPDTTVALRNVFTPANGQYAMASLLPGHYVIIETQPNNWLSHDDGDSTPDADVVTNVDSLDNIIPVTLVPNETDSMNTFIERPVAGAINGVVFQDFNSNLIPDPAEGLAGVVVSLFADANTNGVADNSIVIDTAHTNAMGQYLMTPVEAGHYVLVETNPSGMNSVRDFDPSPDGDAVSNSNLNNDTIPVSIGPAELDAGNHFIDITAGCPLLVNNTNDGGPGSLRFILSCANPGDTIQFHPGLAGDTIEITSATLVIETDVVINSALTPAITVLSSINDLISVAPGVVVELRNVHLLSGLSPGDAGAAIDNYGQLLLHNVIIRKNPLLPPDAHLVRNRLGGQLSLSGNCVIVH